MTWLCGPWGSVLSFLAGIAVGLALAPHLPAQVRRRVTVMRHSLWEFVKRHVVGIAVLGLIVSVGLGVVGYWANGRTLAQLHHQAACSDAYSQRLVQTLKDRADAAQTAILAPSAFFKVLGPLLTNPTLTDQEKLDALTDLGIANEAANKAYMAYAKSQLDNPLPPLPSQVCSGD